MNNDVIEPWQPEVGDYVRVERNPECPSWHSMRRDESVAYGRVEMIDRTMDDPEHWHVVIDETPPGYYTTADAEQDARAHSGHYYLVQDALGSGRIAMLDGWYCAFELTPVSLVEAIGGIVKARMERDRLAPDERLRRALFGAAS